MKSFVILSSLTAMFFAATSFAGGVSIEPGQWEMTTTMSMSMMPQPQTTTLEECIWETELNPEDFNMDEDLPCNIADVYIDGNTARWSINCPTEGGAVMQGSWEFTSNGNTITGRGSMGGDFAGQAMSFDMSWEGRRIGECK